MKITITTIKHENQRYDTVGDWQFLLNKDIEIKTPGDDQDHLFIKVSYLNDEKMNACIAIHELIEALLCRFHEPEITTEMVDKFDIEFTQVEDTCPDCGGSGDEEITKTDEIGHIDQNWETCETCNGTGLLYKNTEIEPGDSPEAPYHEQHMFASGIERAFAEKLGVNWEDYERRIQEL